MARERPGISPDLPQPLYRQVKAYILDRIRSGQWPPETRVPSENELVGVVGVSRMTVNRAFRELTAEGHLVRLQGVGTFVARGKPQGALLEIRSIAEEIAQWGGRHSAEVKVLAREPASAETAQALGLAEGAPVFHSIIVHRDNGVPVQYSDRYVNPAVAPKYLEQDFTRVTPSEYMLSVAPLQELEHVVEAARPDRRSQALLEIGPDEPCLVVYRRTWSFNLVATTSRLVYPGSRYRLGGRYRADPSQGPSVA
ncbi:MAG: histidine utilization repressor [Thermodesulfobacteriota bacterium]